MANTYHKTQLSNGLRVITIPMDSTRTFTAVVLVKTGSKYEEKRLNGISHFLEHMFFKGTKRRPTARQISEEIEGVGGEFNAFTAKENTAYYVKVPDMHQMRALDILSDMMCDPLHEHDEVERERNVVIEEMNMYFDTPMRYVGDLFEELTYGDQPAGWPIIGTKESLHNIKRPEILSYFGQHYQAQDSALVIAGRFDEAEILKTAEQLFGKLPTGEKNSKPKTAEAQEEPRALVYEKKTDQTHLILGFRAFHMFHPDRYALSVLATILGGGMSSRMFTAVRERRGLAYYVRSDVDFYTDSGYSATAAGVENGKVEEAIRAILDEYRAIRSEPVPETEIKKAKEFLKGRTLMDLEESNEVAFWYGQQEILKEEIIRPEDVFKKVDAVTAQDLQRVAREVFKPDGLNLALIGPFSDKERFKNLINTDL
ncbi:MAG: pitrilysin family protein [bacterium]|nr:pitrilysin family protein [bacterium]MDZ4296098.1 pitrilysin family protein [Patescibacteria group bacterium]